MWIKRQFLSIFTVSMLMLFLLPITSGYAYSNDNKQQDDKQGAKKSMAAKFIVSNLYDSGSGSLRQAIDNANDRAGADTISFTVSGTIALGSTLPIIIDAAGLTIDGTGQSITVRGENSRGVMIVGTKAKLNVKNLTVANGVSAYGGGIYNRGTLTVTDSFFTENYATFGFGGGIYNLGTLTVTNSTFSHNSADYGGGIYNSGTLTVTDSNFSNNGAPSAFGGGIFSGGTGTVTNSTFSGNSSDTNGGAISNHGTLTVTNSTFSGNRASWLGSGIENSGTLTVTNSTFSGNSVWDSTGGGDIENSGTLNLANSILANNTGPGENCFNQCPGTVNPSGINLVEDGSCDPNAIVGDPILGPLANNGGPTQTHALLAGSPAIDAADNSICAVAPVNNLDQRGGTRPQDGNSDGIVVCDIGSFEFAATPTNKDQCKNGGWKAFGFKNQGLCIRFVNTGKLGPVMPVHYEEPVSKSRRFEANKLHD